MVSNNHHGHHDQEKEKVGSGDISWAAWCDGALHCICTVAQLQTAEPHCTFCTGCTITCTVHIQYCIANDIAVNILHSIDLTKLDCTKYTRSCIQQFLNLKLNASISTIQCTQSSELTLMFRLQCYSLQPTAAASICIWVQKMSWGLDFLARLQLTNTVAHGAKKKTWWRKCDSP